MVLVMPVACWAAHVKLLKGEGSGDVSWEWEEISQSPLMSIPTLPCLQTQKAVHRELGRISRTSAPRVSADCYRRPHLIGQAVRATAHIRFSAAVIQHESSRSASTHQWERFILRSPASDASRHIRLAIRNEGTYRQTRSLTSISRHETLEGKDSSKLVYIMTLQVAPKMHYFRHSHPHHSSLSSRLPVDTTDPFFLLVPPPHNRYILPPLAHHGR